MKKYIILILLIFVNLLNGEIIFSAENLAKKLSGKILLQVESYGEAWYVNPADYKKYYLNRPANAFDLMRNLGIGITNKNLNKFSIGIIGYNDKDNDNDGIVNRLEYAIGTNPENSDTDNDGYSDLSEIENNYNPLDLGLTSIDNNFTKDHLGKIFLQTEKDGQAWYINPVDGKRYFLGKPADAFEIMKKLSLGITNKNINKITTGYYSNSTPSVCTNCQNNNADQIFKTATNAIMYGDTTTALSCFIPEMQKAIEYIMDFLDQEGKFTLGNIMSGAKLSNSTETEKTYSTEIYFSIGGYKVPINFYVKKQEDDSWLLTNL